MPIWKTESINITDKQKQWEPPFGIPSSTKIVNEFVSFILVMILDAFKFTFSVLLGTHILLEVLTRVFQLWLHLPKLTIS